MTYVILPMALLAANSAVQVRTVAELHDWLVSSPYKPAGETFFRETHGDQAWVHSALSSLLVICLHVASGVC